MATLPDKPPPPREQDLRGVSASLDQQSQYQQSVVNDGSMMGPQGMYNNSSMMGAPWSLIGFAIVVARAHPYRCKAELASHKCAI